MSEDKKPKDSLNIIECLTGAGGSGLVRLPPPEAARLPSLQPKRDLTLGKTQKKSFCPTIPSGRRISKDPGSEEKSSKPERWTAGKKKPNIKKERAKKEIIQSASVFSLGPAGKPSQGSAHSSARGSGGVKQPGKGNDSVIEKVLPVDVTMMDEDDDVEQFTNEIPQKLFSDSSVPPVHLPLYLSAITLNKTTPIRHPKKDGSREASVNVDTSDGATVSAMREGCPTTVADVLTNDSYFFLQLPDQLPVAAHSLAASKAPPASGSNEISSPNVLSDIPDGYIGKLKIHKSGRTRLVLGDTSVDVSLGTSCGFLQELVSVQTATPDSHVTVLGQVTHRLLCTPAFEHILS